MKRETEMKKYFALGVLLGLSGSLWAGGNGGATGAFLTLPAGARSAAMAEGGVALAMDAHALLLNPAALAGLKNASVVGTHGAYLDSSFVDQIAYARPKGKTGAWGVGLQYFSAGSVEETDTLGNPVGSFNPNDLALTVGGAKAFRRLTAGANVKYVRSKLIDSANAFSLDLGLSSRPMLKDRLNLAFVGQNLIGSLKYDQEKNDLPRVFKAAAGYAVKDNWDVAADVVFPTEEDSYFGLSSEYRLKSEGPWGLALRGGYNTRTSDVDGFAGFSMGLGVTRHAMTVDYAFLPFGDVGSTHWITLGWKL